MYYYTSKEFENYNKMFANNVDLIFSLSKEKILISPQKIKELVETLLYNKDTIDQYTIDEIVKNSELKDSRTDVPLRQEVADILGRKFIKEISYRAVIFTFKYASVKNFFYGQYRKFLPEYDYDMINSSEKQKIFFEATMKELDRIDDVISSMADAFNVDQIPYKYLEYIASLIGYESEDKNLVKDYVFRDLIKNMLEVYRVKGTNYSFELFLNFLGFDVVIKEYWFDRRFYYKKKGSFNEYTKVNEKYKTSAIFYLTTENPENYIPKNLSKNEMVFKNEIKGTMDLNMFNRYLSNPDKYGYTLEQLLGYEPGFSNPYTFFKTNVVDFNFSSFKESMSQEVSTDDIKIIDKIFEFLLPIFIKKQYVVTINDWYENVNPDPEENEDWEQSFFLFDDKLKRNQVINIDWEEVVHYDPIYDTTRRWNQNEVYYKGATILYDISIDFERLKEVSLGDVVCYNGLYYIYVGQNGYMIKTPDQDPNNYILYDYYSITTWYENMPITKYQIVRHTYEEEEYPDEESEPIIITKTSDFLYTGKRSVSRVPPNYDSDWYNFEMLLPEHIPHYYMATKNQDVFNRYDYFIDYEEGYLFMSDIDSNKLTIDASIQQQNTFNKYDYFINDRYLYMSKENDNKTPFENNDFWNSYYVSQIGSYSDGMIPVSGQVYFYEYNYYYYDGPTEEQHKIPPNNEHFFLMTQKNYIENVSLWSYYMLEQIDEYSYGLAPENGKVYLYSGNYYYYDGPTEPQWITPSENKYFILMTEKEYTKNPPDVSPGYWKEITLEDNKDEFSVIDRIMFEDGLSEVQAEKKINKLLELVCVTSRTEAETREFYNRRFNLLDKPAEEQFSFVGKYIYLDFSNNSNYVQGAEEIYNVPFIIGESLTVHNNQVVKYKENYFYCYREKTIEFDDETAADNYFNDILLYNNDSNLAAIVDNYAITNYPNVNLHMYVPINYKGIKIEFDSDNFDDVCDTIKQELILHEIVTNDVDPTAEEKDFIFEIIDDPAGKYFRICSNPNKDFEETPYIRISFDFIRTEKTIIDKRGRETTIVDYPWDKNNAFCLFNEYNISPNKRYDFVNSAYPNSVYEFVNRKNYISEIYRSNKFILNKIPRREVFSSFFDKGIKMNMAFKEKDFFAQDKQFPKLNQGFSMNQINQVCFTDYYKNVYFRNKINSIEEDPETGNNVIILKKDDIHQTILPGLFAYVYIVYKYDDNEETIIKSLAQEVQIEDCETFERDGKIFIRLQINNLSLLDSFCFGTITFYPDHYYTFKRTDVEPASKTIYLGMVDQGEQPFIPKPVPDYFVDTRKELIAYDPTFLSDGDIFEVKSDEMFFGKTTYYKWISNGTDPEHWEEILPTRLYIELDYGDHNYQIECMATSSTVSGGKNLVTIDIPDVLDNIVSGRLRVLKTPWKLGDFYNFMGEYLTAGLPLYNYYGYNENNSNEKDLSFDGSGSY